MRTLITGGAGFIGSHLLDLLMSDVTNEVTILDDLSTGSIMNIEQHLDRDNVDFYKGSVLDTVLLSSLVQEADQVFHLAAALGVRRILEQPLQSLKINLHGTENVLELCSRWNKPVVIASTSEIYGKNTSDKLSEDDDRILGSPLVSRWNYAAAKGLDESFAHAYWREHGLQVSIARPFNTVGPRQTGRYGMVVPNLVRQALRNEPLTVFGDGQQTRCFGYVGDVVPALVAMIGNPDTYGQAFNLGGAQEISILDLAQRIVQLTDSESVITLVPYDLAYGEGYEDMRRRVPDNSRAMATLGFSPDTGLDAIITSVADDLRERMGART